MHVVNPHRVSGTRRRCQAIAVLISLQLCLISSVEANHLTVGELGSPDTGTVEPTWRRQWRTSHLIHFFSSSFSYLRMVLLSNACLIFSNALLLTHLNTLPAGNFPVQPVFTVSLPESSTTIIFCCSPLSTSYFVMKCDFAAPTFSLNLLQASDLLHFPECFSKTFNVPELAAAPSCRLFVNRTTQQEEIVVLIVGVVGRFILFTNSILSGCPVLVNEFRGGSLNSLRPAVKRRH